MWLHEYMCSNFSHHKSNVKRRKTCIYVLYAKWIASHAHIVYQCLCLMSFETLKDCSHSGGPGAINSPLIRNFHTEQISLNNCRKADTPDAMECEFRYIQSCSESNWKRNYFSYIKVFTADIFVRSYFFILHFYCYEITYECIHPPTSKHIHSQTFASLLS